MFYLRRTTVRGPSDRGQTARVGGAGVTGNPIQAYTDPGSDLLADPICPWINFTSGFDPSLRKRTVFGASVPSRRIASCQDDV